MDLKEYGFMPHMLPENAQGIPASRRHKEQRNRNIAKSGRQKIRDMY